MYGVAKESNAMRQDLVSKESIAEQKIGTESVASTIDYLRYETRQERQTIHRFDLSAQHISGCVLAVQGAEEIPVAGARVELHRVESLRAQTACLSNDVLDHCRTLLLTRMRPVELYLAGDNVVDAPLTRFDDILKLRDIPGYELLVAAAKSQPNNSFTKLLCNNPAILQPLLCYYHPNSFPAVCTAHATTDAAGFFHFSVAEQGNLDEQPGYRFIVRRSISHNLYVTLYNPTPAAWHTYWDLPDDKTVTLRTRHPLALREQP
jgi:protein tyrosine phosphatase (PTP) superfamily phosphohydrolase (DUF442 family)